MVSPVDKGFSASTRCGTGCLRSNNSTCLNALLLERSEEISGCPEQFSTVI